MPSAFYGPHFLNGRILYDTDSELARRPVWFVCTLDWELGICIRGGVLEIGVAYSIAVNITCLGTI
jgi:hypothetical protein